MYEHPRGGKNNFGDAKNGPPDSYMYFMNQIKVTVWYKIILLALYCYFETKINKKLIKICRGLLIIFVLKFFKHLWHI